MCDRLSFLTVISHCHSGSIALSRPLRHHMATEGVVIICNKSRSCSIVLVPCWFKHLQGLPVVMNFACRALTVSVCVRFLNGRDEKAWRVVEKRSQVEGENEMRLSVLAQCVPE